MAMLETDMQTKRAQGCLLGQLAGDSLGALVEFMRPEKIKGLYPKGVRELANGGPWGILAGQPTDDSEMALALARTLAKHGHYSPAAAMQAYVSWVKSEPFDCGVTIASALGGRLNPASQANGALMRASPLGIFGARHTLSDVAKWADEDAALTHPNAVCRQANALYCMAIAHAIDTGIAPRALYKKIVAWAKSMKVEPTLLEATERAATRLPQDFYRQQGWVLIAFQNALWQLLHAPNAEEGVVDAVMRGGDTDTNAAICGALLGAVHGIDAIPKRWVEAILRCQPQAGKPGVRRPRPERFWPVDALELAEVLVVGTTS
jgi:ADP-ribosylglycohydrolase